jgi:hypothetical protein
MLWVGHGHSEALAKNLHSFLGILVPFGPQKEKTVPQMPRRWSPAVTFLAVKQGSNLKVIKHQAS